MTTTKEYYQEAISQLEVYCANEPDPAKRAGPNEKIKEYRFNIIDKTFDEMVERTNLLNTLMADLQQVIANASNVPTISGTLEKLTGLVSSLTNVVKGGS